MKNQKDLKLKNLIENRQKTLERLRKVEARMKEEKDNEDVWPGHSSTVYYDNLNDYHVLKDHLEGIDREIKKNKKQIIVHGPQVST